MDRGKVWIVLLIAMLVTLPASPVLAASDLRADDMQCDLLIIAPADFVPALEPLREHKEHTGIPAAIVTLESIAEGYAGRDLPEKVKTAIAGYREQYGTAYVMLVGDCDRFPVRYIRATNTQWGTLFYPSDLYYADLYDQSMQFDTWDADNDGYYGEMDFDGFAEKDLAKLNLDDIDRYPDVAVGRVPASTIGEVETYVDKVIRYEFGAYKSGWFSDAVWAVDYSWGFPADKDRLDAYLSGFTIHKPYLDPDWTTGIADPYDRRDFRASELNRLMNEGAGFVNYCGHGSPRAWAWVYDQSESPTGPYHDLDDLTNADALPVVYAVSCLTGHFYFDQCVSNGFAYDYYRTAADTEYLSALNVAVRPEPMPIQPAKYDGDSLAEEFTVMRDTGAVAYIGCTEKHEFGGKDIDKYFFEAYSTGWKPPVLGWMWNTALTSWLNAADLTEFYGFIHMHKVMLFGDPSLRVGGISRIQLNDYAGTWHMDHDGWKGTLELEANPLGYIEQEPDLVGTYTGTDGAVYDAWGYVRTWQYPIPDAWGPDHKIELHIAFAEESVFEGYLWTGTKDAMAGATEWHTTPYGWYATRAGTVPGTASGTIGTLSKDDFAGTYAMNHNGWKGTLKLWAVPDDPIEQLPNLRGQYTGADGAVFDAWAYVRTDTYPLPAEFGPDHTIELHIDFAQESIFTGYLFTRTENTLAGTTSWNNIPYGWYATRCPDGDLNGNGIVDWGDVVKLAYMSWNMIPADLTADFNANGFIDWGDVVKLAYYYWGKIGDLSVPAGPGSFHF